MNPDWLIPDWPAPAGIRAVCSTRAGGASAPPYDSLNLGDHVGDRPGQVANNRAIFQAAIGAQPIFLNQVHGTEVLPIDANTPHASSADACLTKQVGIACTIMVADCLPMLLTTTRGDWVAAAHAGWRGLAGSGGDGVVEATLKHFCALALMEPALVATNVIVWLGPCIGPQAFEVGDEVRASFVAHDAQAALMFQAIKPGKWLADLAGLARQRLAALGLSRVYGNDSSPPWCTASQPSRFFSHRRDGISGRFAACIWRAA